MGKPDLIQQRVSLLDKLVSWRNDAGEWVSACRNMAIVGNVGKGRQKKRLNEVVKDDLKKCGLDGGLANEWERWKAQVMGKTSDRPVRARTRDVNREEREINYKIACANQAFFVHRVV